MTINQRLRFDLWNGERRTRIRRKARTRRTLCMLCMFAFSTHFNTCDYLIAIAIHKVLRAPCTYCSTSVSPSSRILQFPSFLLLLSVLPPVAALSLPLPLPLPPALCLPTAPPDSPLFDCCMILIGQISPPLPSLSSYPSSATASLYASYPLMSPPLRSCVRRRVPSPQGHCRLRCLAS